VTELADLACLLRRLRRRHAHERGRAEPAYREMAGLTGLSRAGIGTYFSGGALPPTDRFDTITRLLGATPVEQGTLATARDHVAERRRHRRGPGGRGPRGPAGGDPHAPSAAGGRPGLHRTAARALLVGLIGERSDAEATATTVLAEQGAGLPPALRVSAELAVSRPDASLEQLVRELEDQQERLDLLDADGAPRTAVRAVVSWSYRTARLFGLLGPVPGPDIDEPAVVALAGGRNGPVTTDLEGLVRAHLVQRLGSGRHAQHDLLRAVVCHASANGWEGHAPGWRGSCCGTSTAGTSPREWRSTPTRCGPPARPGTGPGQARAPIGLATAHRRQDRIGPLHEALTLFRGIDDRGGQARALDDLALIHQRQGQLEAVPDELEGSLALSRQLDEPSGQAYALLNIGMLLVLQGHLEGARDAPEEALGLFELLKNPSGRAHCPVRSVHRAVARRRSRGRRARRCRPWTPSRNSATTASPAWAWPVWNRDDRTRRTPR